jgi:hypothetical protein
MATGANNRDSNADRDERFKAWLAMNEYLLDTEFLAGDVPGLPDDPFTEEGLRVAEAEALRRFADVAEVLAPENRQMYDKFVRYIGETFVRGLGAQWTNRPMVDDGKPHIDIRYPWQPETLDVPAMLTSAVHRRTGQEWAFVYRMATEDRENWLTEKQTKN